MLRPARVRRGARGSPRVLTARGRVRRPDGFWTDGRADRGCIRSGGGGDGPAARGSGRGGRRREGRRQGERRRGVVRRGVHGEGDPDSARRGTLRRRRGGYGAESHVRKVRCQK